MRNKNNIYGGKRMRHLRSLKELEELNHNQLLREFEKVTLCTSESRISGDLERYTNNINYKNRVYQEIYRRMN